MTTRMSKPRGGRERIASLKFVQTVPVDQLLKLLNKGTVSATVTAAASLLRQWMDEWLDSGYEKGVDSPRKRSLAGTNGIWAVTSFSSLVLQPNLKMDGLSIWLDPEDDLFASNIARNSEAEKVFAQSQFVSVLLSELRLKLAKCRAPHCGVYFVLKQWKRTFKNGTRCHSCVEAERAVVSAKFTEEKRERVRTKLWELAAIRFTAEIVRVGDRRPNADLKRKMAVYLSEKIKRSDVLRGRYRKGVKMNWVALYDNWNEIRKIAKHRAQS
jgi:hypothetical protein